MELDDIYERLKKFDPMIAEEFLWAKAKSTALWDLLQAIKDILGVQPGDSVLQTLRKAIRQSQREVEAVKPISVPKKVRRAPPILPKEDREELLCRAASLGLAVSNKDSSKRLAQMIKRAERQGEPLKKSKPALFKGNDLLC